MEDGGRKEKGVLFLREGTAQYLSCHKYMEE